MDVTLVAGCAIYRGRQLGMALILEGRGGDGAGLVRRAISAIGHSDAFAPGRSSTHEQGLRRPAGRAAIVRPADP